MKAKIRYVFIRARSQVQGEEKSKLTIPTKAGGTRVLWGTQRGEARLKAGDHYLALVKPLLQPALAGEKPAARCTKR